MRNIENQNVTTSGQTILGFDYGEKRIGIAVGQTLTATATPLEIIKSRNNQPDWQRIEQLIDEWRPDAFVVGHPLTLHGERQDTTGLSEKFARQLQGRFNLPVYYADEQLSTYEAKNRHKDTRNLDATAAQIILETWLTGHEKKLISDTMPAAESDTKQQ